MKAEQFASVVAQHFASPAMQRTFASRLAGALASAVSKRFGESTGPGDKAMIDKLASAVARSLFNTKEGELPLQSESAHTKD